MLALVLVPAAMAQDKQPSACNTRQVLVGVRQQDGRPVPGLQAANFQAKAKKVVLPVAGARVSDRPMKVVLAVDTSTSMTTLEHRWALVHELTAVLTRFLHPRDEVGLILFARDVSESVAPSSERDIILPVLPSYESFRAVKPQGGTRLFDSVLPLIKNGTLGSGDVLLLLSDGGDNHSKVREKAFLQAVERSGVRIFAAGFSEPFPYTGREDEGSRLFDELAARSGGDVIWFRERPILKGKPPTLDEKTRARVASVAKTLVVQIDMPYLLELTIPSAVQAESRWQLQAVDADGRKLEGVVLSYPDHLPACPAAVAEASR